VPELSVTAQATFRSVYGALLLLTLLWTLPHARRFFLSERWGGYTESSRAVDFVQNPVVAPFVLATWLACSVLLLAGVWTVAASAVNLVLCHYFFVRMRWRSVARGLGAPGFMTYWLGAAVFLLELTSHAAGDVRGLALLVLQVDFAFIMLSAGVYKLSAGYARDQGMEYGLVNPEWGYWWRRWSEVAPGRAVFRVLNHLAWTTEIAAAVLMLVPVTREMGAFLIMASFVFIATQIRLGWLCEMVILAGVLYFSPGGWGDRVFTSLVTPASLTSIDAGAVVAIALTTVLAGYLALLPLAHAGLFVNFYLRRPLPRVVQRALDAYTNFFGLIIWRVFSVDVINFVVLVHRRRPDAGARTLVSRWGQATSLRYCHVAEAITMTSVFTTLKYHPSDRGLFETRLLRYARTVPTRDGDELVFEVRSVVKGRTRFELVPVAEWVVDPMTRTVREHPLGDTEALRRPHAVSPVHEGVRPGTYAPRPM
jgi:hypothetical protein